MKKPSRPLPFRFEVFACKSKPSSAAVVIAVVLVMLAATLSACWFEMASGPGTAALDIAIRAPFADLAWLFLSVSGPNMNTITKTYSAPISSLKVEVPAGDARVFRLDAYVAGESGFPAYRGEASVDLVPGTSTEVMISMEFVAGKVYVANNGSGSVAVIDGARNSVISTVVVGASPGGVAANPATGKVYVDNAGGESLSVIETAGDTVIKTISLTTSSGYADPHFVGINPSTNRIYVSQFYDGPEVYVVNGIADSVVTFVDSAGSYSYGVGVNERTNKVYVARWNPPAVLDGTSNSYLGEVTGGSWSECLGVAVDAGAARVYVADGGNDVIHVVDTGTDSEVTTVTTGANPYGVDVNTVTKKIYAANYGAGTVTVVDGRTNAVLATLAVGINPMGVAVNETTGRVYVANSGSDTVTVIDGITDSVLTTIAVGSSPFLLDVMP